MPRLRIELDRAGVAEMAKGRELQALVRGIADQVANNARNQGHTVESGDPLPVEVTSTVTDRARANVTITHAAGLPMQAKYGVLTKAAAQAGLDVKD
jgi:hypothetical protein